jgi:hypothetical protein
MKKPFVRACNSLRLAAPLLFLLVAACRQSAPLGTEDPAATDPGGNQPKRTAIITFSENIKDGDWIQVDDLPQLYHRLDTSRFSVSELSGTQARTVSPSMYTDTHEKLSTSELYSLGMMSNRWLANFASGGLPGYSLSVNLVNIQRAAELYDAPRRPNQPYAVRFKGLSSYDAYLNTFSDENLLYSSKKWHDQFGVLIIERTDGQPIRIRTSEGYAAKIEYQ